MSRSGLVIAIATLVALGGLTWLGIIALSETPGTLEADLKSGTLSFETLEEKDAFAVLSTLERDKPEALGAWLASKGFLHTSDTDGLREKSYFRYDDGRIADKMAASLPEVDTTQGTSSIFTQLLEQREKLNDIESVKVLRQAARGNRPPFQFLGRSFDAASPDAPRYQPPAGVVHVAEGTDLAIHFSGKVARLYNSRTRQSLDLLVRPLQFGAADVWLNKSQFCRLGLTGRVENIEIGPSPISAADYDPAVSDPSFETSSLGPRECATVVAASSFRGEPPASR